MWADPSMLAWASVEDGDLSRSLLDRTNVNGGAIAVGHRRTGHLPDLAGVRNRAGAGYLADGE
jgi:hypothetical protein